MTEETKPEAAQAVPEMVGPSLTIRMSPDGRIDLESTTGGNMFVQMGLLGFGLFLTLKAMLDAEKRVIQPTGPMPKGGFLSGLRKSGIGRR